MKVRPPLKRQAIEAKVQCEGKLHAIALRPSGRIVLKDHPSRHQDQSYEALGGQECRCREVLRAWREKIASRLPPALRPAFQEASSRRAARASHKTRALDPLRLARDFLTNRHRSPWRVYEICAEAARLLRTCDYRQPLQGAGEFGTGFFSLSRPPRPPRHPLRRSQPLGRQRGTARPGGLRQGRPQRPAALGPRGAAGRDRGRRREIRLRGAAARFRSRARSACRAPVARLQPLPLGSRPHPRRLRRLAPQVARPLPARG